MLRRVKLWKEKGIDNLLTVHVMRNCETILKLKERYKMQDERKFEIEDECKCENEETKEKSQVMWMPICMCLGLCIGMSLGSLVFDNMSIGMCIGISLGGCRGERH